MNYSHQFVELDKNSHERGLFDCGEFELNNFIKTKAAKHMATGISKTMVLAESNSLDNGKYKLCAFYTLTFGSLKRETLPKKLAQKLPFYPIPIFLIAQIAVDLHYQHQGLGKITLIEALKYLVKVNNHLKAYAIIVDCLNENVEQFYLNYGFERLLEQGDKIRLFIPLKTAAMLFN